MTGVLSDSECKPSFPTEAIYYVDYDIKVLLLLARELQRHTHDKPFLLSAKTAGILTGRTEERARKCLHLLCQDGLLEVAQRGGLVGGKVHAHSYYYRGRVWPDDPA